MEKASPYLINSTYSVIIANLARPIGPFNEKLALEQHKQHKATMEAIANGVPTPGEVK